MRSRVSNVSIGYWFAVLAALLFWEFTGQYYCMEEKPVVDTPNGLIEGTADGISRSGLRFYQFRGIQYAIVEQRFKPAVPVPPWNGTIEVTQFGPSCNEVDEHGQENCLYLNIYTPSISKCDEVPVVVFIHGGAFQAGSGNVVGPNYFLDEDVILVTINYRLGILGFLATGDEHCPGNNGLKDQVMALKWIQQNIRAFGGDPQKVTIMGQSAGSCSVTYHLVSPMSRGLFRSVIAQSGNFLNPWQLTRNPLQYAQKVAKILGCGNGSSTEKIVECLKAVPVAKLASEEVLTEATIKFFNDPVAAFSPTVEPFVDNTSTFLSEHPYKLLASGKTAKVPVLVGWVKEDGLTVWGAPLLYGSDPSATASRTMLEQNWSSVAPTTFYLEEALPPERWTEVASKIRDYYFPSGFSLKDVDSMFEPLSHLYSDRLIISSGIKFMNMYSKEGPTFPYLYTFNKYPLFGFSSEFGNTTLKGKLLDASHAAELDVLFSPLFDEVRNEPDHQKVSMAVVKLWASFIKNGAPTDTYGSELSFPPIDPTLGIQKFYELNEDTKLTENIFAKRMAFWESLELKDFVISGSGKE